MKIASINPLNHFKFNLQQKQVCEVKIQSLQMDTISFGYLNKKVPKDIQLYRCIGESEYQKLINGETISSSGYATSSPKGWQANGWNDGFTPSDSFSNCYFITFKTGRFEDIIDKRDEEEDTRYGIYDDYSIEDISNIREGFNTHGELVWAENFEEAKEKDIKHKKEEITRLIKIIKNNYQNHNKEDVIDELISYGKEFPEIVNLFKQCVDFSDNEQVNDFADIIASLSDDKFLSDFRKCMEYYLNGYTPKERCFYYLMYHGDRTDLDSYLQIMKKMNLVPFFRLAVYCQILQKKMIMKILLIYSIQTNQKIWLY